MSTVRVESIKIALDRADALIDYNIHNDFHKQHEFRQKTILADKSLTKDEKTEAIGRLNRLYDRRKLIYNSGTKKNCENCRLKCLATLFCELCVRNYLKSNFSNWTSKNDDIDNLIQKCKWKPYNNLKDVEFLTRGGCSEIYTAVWVDGMYTGWDSKKQQLKRLGAHRVVLKKLGNIENASQNWFEEACNLK